MNKWIYVLCVLLVISIALPVITLVYFNPQVAMLELKVSILELQNTLLESRIKWRDDLIEMQKSDLDRMTKRLGEMTDEKLKELGVELPGGQTSED